MEEEREPVSKVRQVLFNLGFFGWGMFTSIVLFVQSAFLLEVAELPPSYVACKRDQPTLVLTPGQLGRRDSYYQADLGWTEEVK